MVFLEKLFKRNINTNLNNPDDSAVQNHLLRIIKLNIHLKGITFFFFFRNLQVLNITKIKPSRTAITDVELHTVAPALFALKECRILI